MRKNIGGIIFTFVVLLIVLGLMLFSIPNVA